jgi:hypothetical protein
VTNKLKTISFMGALMALTACADYNPSGRPGDLVPTEEFVSNVLEEHDVIGRKNTSQAYSQNDAASDV